MRLAWTTGWAAIVGASSFAACNPAAPFLRGTVLFDACPVGPGPEACDLSERPAACIAAQPVDPVWRELAPEAGASITASPGDKVAVSDAVGVFVLADLEPGRYALAAAVPWTVETRRLETQVVGSTSSDDDYASGTLALVLSAA